MHLNSAWFLLLLLAWLPMAWVYVRREKKRPAVRFSDLSILRKLPQSPMVRLRHVPFALRLLGVGLLVVALARPQKGTSEEEVTTEGVDIMLVLDVSFSMKSLDFQPRFHQKAPQRQNRAPCFRQTGIHKMSADARLQCSHAVR